MNSKPLYNSRIIDNYLRLIRRSYPHVDINDLLSHAGILPFEVADQSHWFTQEQVNLFHQRLKEVTQNNNIAREAGRYAASPDALGLMRLWVLGTLSAAKLFEVIGKFSSNLTRSSRYESRKIAANKIEMKVTHHEGTKENPFQCANRHGFIEAAALIFTNRLPRVEHPECIFKGGSSCRYIVTWEPAMTGLLKKAANLSIVLFILYIMAGVFTSPKGELHSMGAFLLGTVALGLSVMAGSREKRELKNSLSNLSDSTNKLVEQTDINYNNALMANEIGQAISCKINTEDILSTVIQILQKRLDFDRGMILLANDDKTRLEFRGGFGYREEEIALVGKIGFHLNRPESKGAFVLAYREQRPFLVNDINDIESDLSPRSLDLARRLGTRSFICCPIICEGESMGTLAVDNLSSKRPLVKSDMSLLMGIAPIIGISLNNARLLSGRTTQFRSTLEVLAATIDARDLLTAGHSQKVTEYSLGICQELRLPKEFQDMIRVAALLHDYGKIGVPDSILKKDGRLTPEEYEIVKTHASKTREILERIEFHGNYRQVPEIAGAHHEKLDGSGYPLGLKGKEIPLGARIIAVADFFEAITSKRHYRDPMPLDVAFKLLDEEKGTHFEENIVNAFIRYFEKNDLGKSLQLARNTKNRVPYRTEVTFRAGEQIFIGQTHDIGTYGLYLVSNQELSKDTILDLSFHLPGSTHLFVKALGRIAWVNHASLQKSPSFPPGFGVEFLEVHSETIKSIESWVESAAA